MAMKSNDPILIKELRNDEGVRHSPYFDTVGVETVGVGHNMEVNSVPSAWTFPLTDAQVDRLLAADLEDVFRGLDKRLPWWRDLSYVRQRVLVNMAFNLGIDGLLGFHNTLAMVKDGRYAMAAVNMLKSKWATQVKGRATRLAGMMRNG